MSLKNIINKLMDMVNTEPGLHVMNISSDWTATVCPSQECNTAMLVKGPATIVIIRDMAMYIAPVEERRVRRCGVCTFSEYNDNGRWKGCVAGIVRPELNDGIAPCDSNYTPEEFNALMNRRKK